MPLLKRLVDFIPVPVILYEFKDGTPSHLYLNKQFLAVIGYSLDEIPGINEWFDIAYPDPAYQKTIRQYWASQADKKQRTGSTFIESVQACVRCKDGSDRWFEIEAGEWTDTIGITTFMDIDDLIRQKQYLEQLNAVKDKLFSVISHDVRAPLASLQAILTLVESGDLSPEKLREVIPLLSQQLTHIFALFDNLFLWASKQLVTHKTPPIPFNMPDLIDQNIGLLQLVAQQKKITITTVRQTLLAVLADREMVDIIFRNILSNAIKFTPTGGTITIQYQQHGRMGHIEVLDTGIGISQETIGKIARREMLTSQPGTANEKGTGLGLVFCQETIEAIGGSLSITSAPGQGSRVGFSVPLVSSKN